MKDTHVGRRGFLLAGGAVTVGASTLAFPALASSLGTLAARTHAHILDEPGSSDIATPGVRADQTRSRKPVYLPAELKAGHAAVAVADALFWTDIMMEHALFFTLLMPGESLAAERGRAVEFMDGFAAAFNYVRTTQWTSESVPQMVQELVPKFEAFIMYKDEMRALQESGALKSLVWPLFFAHTAYEARRFVGRLNRFAQGDSAVSLDEAKDFWTKIMAEHFEFVAHLLDPQEKELIAKVAAMAVKVYGIHEIPAEAGVLHDVAAEIIDIKVAAEQGIETGQIKSIIHPALADHVLREAIKFANELERTQM